MLIPLLTGSVLGLFLGIFIGLWLNGRRATASAIQVGAERATMATSLQAAQKDIENLRERLRSSEDALSKTRTDLAQKQAALAAAEARAEAETQAAAEKLSAFENAQLKMREAFEVLSSKALRDNNQSFLEVAKTLLEQQKKEAAYELEARKQSIEGLVSPIRESLTKMDQHLRELEGERKGAYSALVEQVRNLGDSQRMLQSETSSLVRALRTPTTRGNWGEMQLQRVVEMAGMLEYCDFVQQQTVGGPGERLRPDLIVRLPGGKSVVVDSKAPLQAYLDYVEAKTEEEKSACLARHAAQVHDHISKLSAKSYWESLQPTPEFVVMFLPGEMCFSAALQADPALIEEGVKQRVIIASPVTLIALLRAVAYGWRQEQIAENAQRIGQLGRVLYDRLRTFSTHMDHLGRALGRSLECYNGAVGSLERSVFPSARKFSDFGLTTADIGELSPIDTEPRQLQLQASDQEDAASAAAHVAGK